MKYVFLIFTILSAIVFNKITSPVAENSPARWNWEFRKWAFFDGFKQIKQHVKSYHFGDNFLLATREAFSVFESKVFVNDDRGCSVEKYETNNGVEYFRIYPKNEWNGNTIIYYHSGGYFSFTGSYTGMAACEHTNAQIIVPNYRRTPEVNHPIPRQDCIDVTRHVLLEKRTDFKISKYGIFGDSVGGGLALSIPLSIDFSSEFHEKPSVIFSAYPVTQMLRLDTPSYQTKQPLFNKNAAVWMWLGIVGEELSTASYEIFYRNLHLSKNIRENSELMARVDPEVWGDGMKGFTPAYVPQGDFANNLPERVEKFLVDSTLQPGLMDDQSLDRVLKSTKSLHSALFMDSLRPIGV